MMSLVEQWLERIYVRWIRPRISEEIYQQRLKMAWFIWDYLSFLELSNLTVLQRLSLIWKCMTVDWHVLHGHRPAEIVCVSRAIAERPARDGECVVEAGCYRGGSSAKFSLVCEMLGYRLHVYDSFAGVEALTPEEKLVNYDFSGEYAAPEMLVRANMTRFGAIAVCTFHPGWFSATLAGSPIDYPAKVVFIDCDVVKGTKEVLQGVLPRLVGDGWIFSQDFHIKPIRELLQDPQTWKDLGASSPHIVEECHHLASMRFNPK